MGSGRAQSVDACLSAGVASRKTRGVEGASKKAPSRCPAVDEEVREVPHGLDRARVRRAQAALLDVEGARVEGLGLVLLPLGPQDVGEVRQRLADLEVVRAELPLPGLDRAPEGLVEQSRL